MQVQVQVQVLVQVLVLVQVQVQVLVQVLVLVQALVQDSLHLASSTSTRTVANCRNSRQRSKSLALPSDRFGWL